MGALWVGLAGWGGGGRRRDSGVIGWGLGFSFSGGLRVGLGLVSSVGCGPGQVSKGHCSRIKDLALSASARSDICI